MGDEGRRIDGGDAFSIRAVAGNEIVADKVEVDLAVGDHAVGDHAVGDHAVVDEPVGSHAVGDHAVVDVTAGLSTGEHMTTAGRDTTAQASLTPPYLPYAAPRVSHVSPVCFMFQLPDGVMESDGLVQNRAELGGSKERTDEKVTKREPARTHPISRTRHWPHTFPYPPAPHATRFHATALPPRPTPSPTQALTSHTPPPAHFLPLSPLPPPRPPSPRPPPL